MKKAVKLTESDLSRIVRRVINEQGQADMKNHPMNNPFWEEMISAVEGEGVETIKYIPNKMLVINAFGNKYTITKG